MKNLFYFILPLILFSACSSEPKQDNYDANYIGIKFETYTNFDSIVEFAQSLNKPIFIDCYASWCGPCKMMSAQVFPDTTVGQYFNAQYVSYKIDMEKEGKSLREKFNIIGYPTYIFLNPLGEEMHRAVGYIQKDEFIDLAARAKDSELNMAGYQKSFKEGNRALDFLAQYANTLSDAGLSFEEPVKAYLSQLETNDYYTQSTYDFFLLYLNDINSKETKFLLDQKNKLISVFGEFQYNMLMQRIAEAYFRTYVYRPLEPKNLTAVINYLKDNNIEEANKYAFEFEFTFHRRRQDWLNYEKTALAGVEKYLADDDNALNNAAWIFYEHIENPESIQEAVKWAIMSVQLNPQYSNMDTYASILFKAGVFDEAKYAAQKAIELGKAQGQDVGTTQALLEKINLKLS